MAAERLYYTSAVLDFDTTIADIRLTKTDELGQLWQVALAETAFYPTGGGQPSDRGMLIAYAPSGASLEVPIEAVEEDEDGEVWHYVRKPLIEGTEVQGRVLASRRMDHEQQHSGQHLLSAVFLRELTLTTVSFHLGAESSTIDLDTKERPTEEQLHQVEEAANRVVAESRPIWSRFVEREYAEDMLRRGDLRKLPEREGPMRVVQIQGIEFNACGGTHVENTGAIGAISIRRLEKVKQGWRVEFCCGQRVVRAARKDYIALDAVARTLSVGAADVQARVEALLEEKKAQAKELKKLKALLPPSA
ncbi:alanyl-tRNA editing protein [Granulicella cerasi]|uniref:Alanyl-tRNA editing protein n=1 Tax=Granulicella cerasi TaxID=741063 RepID=A0ABW1ZDU2_9BACT|nr:alanyl-tRNA editing protein [Granulicella cerasi]